MHERERDLLQSDALRAFAVFAEHRNFTTAAAALQISQPSLHVKIKKLAAVLGTTLYERDGRSLRLTSDGEQLALYAADSRRRLDDFLAQRHGRSTSITIAAGRAALRWVLPDLLRRVGNTGRTLRVLTANREHALEALATGRVDLGVVAYDPPPNRFESLVLATYPQLLAIAAAHPLAAKAEVRLAELDQLSLVVPPQGRPHRRTLDRALHDAGSSVEITAEVDGWDLMVECIAVGIGMAAVVNGCVELPAGITGVPVADLPRVSYWATWRPQRRASVDRVLGQPLHPTLMNSSRRASS